MVGVVSGMVPGVVCLNCICCVRFLCACGVRLHFDFGLLFMFRVVMVCGWKLNLIQGFLYTVLLSGCGSYWCVGLSAVLPVLVNFVCYKGLFYLISSVDGFW